MKIAYDSQIFSGQIYGGVSRYFCEIASRISLDYAQEVNIVAPLNVNAYTENLPKGIFKGFPSPFPYNFMRLQQRAASMLLSDIMLRHIKPDIIHETYFFQYPLGIKYTPRVITIHDMIHEKFVSQFQYGDKTARHKSFAAQRADHIICVSKSTKRDAIEILGLNPDKISVIYHGYDLMNASYNELSCLDKSFDFPYLLYVGARGGYKNFYRFIEAYANSKVLKELKLICFGGGVFQMEEIELLQKLNIDSQVIHQSGSDKQLSLLYRGAKAFIYPTLYEGFGMPPLEAMAHGCPVICSNTSSIPEVVGDAVEFFEPTCIDSIRNSVEHVIESNNYRDLLIAKGYERLKFFSWDKCASETIRIYKKLI